MSCPACSSVWASVLTHGHASLRPRNRPWFGAKPAQSLELGPATQGSQMLAHLGLGKKLKAGGSSARLASVPVPDGLPEQHSRASCRACGGKLWREMAPRPLCSALLGPLACRRLCGLQPLQALPRSHPPSDGSCSTYCARALQAPGRMGAESSHQTCPKWRPRGLMITRTQALNYVQATPPPLVRMILKWLHSTKLQISSHAKWRLTQFRGHHEGQRVCPEARAHAHQAP